MLSSLLALLVVGPLPHPDCQRACLGECAWSWKIHRCTDTRVVFIGTMDGIVPTGYEPAESKDFDAYYLPDNSPYGTYPTEQEPASEKP